MIKFLLMIIVVLYIWNPQFFERYLFVNEILSVFGFYIFYINRNFFLSNEIIKAVLPFVFLVGFLWILSILRYENLYVYMRRLSLFYSFFVLFSFYYLFIFVEKSKLKWLWFFAVQKVNLVFSFMYLATKLSKDMKSFWIFSAVFILFYTMAFGGSTGVFSLLVTFLIFYSNRRVNLILGSFMFIILSTLYAVIYSDYFSGSLYLNDIYEFMDEYEALALDGNITVRLFMWKEIILNILPSTYFFGIGFGTVLFDEQFINFVGLRSQLIDDELLPYTLSPHNSFVYIAASMGLPGVLAIIYMYKKLIDNYKLRYLLGLSTIKERQVFIIFIAYSIAAAMNVVIESPIHSGLFWGILGIYLLEQKRSDNRSSR